MTWLNTRQEKKEVTQLTKIKMHGTKVVYNIAETGFFSSDQYNPTESMTKTSGTQNKKSSCIEKQDPNGGVFIEKATTNLDG